MGAKKEHRDAEHTRAVYNQKAEEVHASRLYDRAMQERDTELNQLTARVAELEGELAHVRMYHDLRVAERDYYKEELAQAQRALEYHSGQEKANADYRQQAQHTINVLWAIIKLGMTPERYHELRAIVRED